MPYVDFELDIKVKDQDTFRLLFFVLTKMPIVFKKLSKICFYLNAMYLNAYHAFH